MIATIQDIRRLRNIIKGKGWKLWNLFEGFSSAYEAEMMVVQTISASVVNYDKSKEAFSVRGDRVLNSRGNRVAYQMLLDREYFEEGEIDSTPVIFITQLLVDLLDNYFKGRK